MLRVPTVTVYINIYVNTVCFDRLYAKEEHLHNILFHFEQFHEITVTWYQMK